MTDLATETGLLETCWEYLFLGLIQGLTEFLPISSTAHLKVLPMMMGWADPGISVSAMIQLGSILAVFAYFRHDLKEILKGISLAFKRGQWREPKALLGIAIFTGTIPILLAGMVIKLCWPGFENSPLRSIPAIAIVSILMAALLGLSDKLGSRERPLSKISSRDGLNIGIGQMFALIPGVSRSGITLSTSLLRGFNRQDAARFSFLLGIPSITIAGIVELKDALSSPLKTGLLPICIGIFTSAAVSWLAIDWLLKYLQSNNTRVFVIYRLLFGVVLLAWWWVS